MIGSPGSATAVIVEYLAKTTILLAPALLAAAVSKRRTAAFRHFLLTFALIGLLAIPVLSLLPFGWRAPLLPARPGDSMKQALSIPAGLMMDASLPPANTAVAMDGGEPAVESHSSRLTGAGTFFRDGNGSAAYPAPQNDPSSAARIVEPDLTIPFAAGRRGVSLDALIILLWAGGLAFLLLRLAFGLAGAVRLTREGSGLSDSVWRVLLLHFLSTVSLRRTVRLISHPEVLVPMTWGWRKPVILLPTGTESWTETERSAALFHELSHVKRADFLFLFLVRLSLSLFWWNPLCWAVYARIRREQEIACDELVLRAGIKPSTYAAGLLAFRRSAGLRWNPSAALPGLFGTSSFQERLAAILKQKRIIKEVKMKVRISVAAAVVLAVALIGTARPAVGLETKAEPAPVLAAAAAPAPAVMLSGQELKVQTASAQEKEKESEKSKIEKKVVINADGKSPVEITIVQDGKTKTLVLDKPLTISTDKDGKIVVRGADSGAFEILEGKPWHIEMKDGKVLKLDGAQALTITKEGGKILLSEPFVVKEFKGEKGEIATGVKIIKEVTAEKDGIKIVVEGGGKGEAKAAWTIAEPVKGNVFYTVKEKDGKSVAYVGTEPLKGGVAYTWSSADKLRPGISFVTERDKELLEKIKAIREQAASIKAGKLDITELEKSLEKLESELKDKEGKLNYFMVGKNLPDIGKTVSYLRADKGMAAGKLDIISEAKEGTIVIVLIGREKADFDRALDKLKKELPEGYKIVESKYDDESGAITFKIEGPADKKHDADFVRKLVDSLKEDIKK